MENKGYAVGVLGATGTTGAMNIEILLERNFPIREIRAYASNDSVGRLLEIAGLELTCLPLNEETIDGLDLALIATPASVSEEWAPKLNRQGTAVIDKSSRWRDESPLVIPEVNPEALDNFDGIVSSPNCSSIQTALVVNPIRLAAGLKRLYVCTDQAVSGAGHKAEEELKKQALAVLSGESDELTSEVFPHRIAFNILPQVGEIMEDGQFDEEDKMRKEIRRILDHPSNYWFDAECARASVFNGHSQILHITPASMIDLDDCRKILETAPGVRLIEPYPTALDADGQDDVLVGKIRRDESNPPPAIRMRTAMDNTRKGASTNTVQIAELMIAKGII